MKKQLLNQAQRASYRICRIHDYVSYLGTKLHASKSSLSHWTMDDVTSGSRIYGISLLPHHLVCYRYPFEIASYIFP